MPLIKLKKSIIPSCDVSDLSKLKNLVKETCSGNKNFSRHKTYKRFNIRFIHATYYTATMGVKYSSS